MKYPQGFKISRFIPIYLCSNSRCFLARFDRKRPDNKSSQVILPSPKKNQSHHICVIRNSSSPFVCSAICLSMCHTAQWHSCAQSGRIVARLGVSLGMVKKFFGQRSSKVCPNPTHCRGLVNRTTRLIDDHKMAHNLLHNDPSTVFSYSLLIH